MMFPVLSRITGIYGDESGRAPVARFLSDFWSASRARAVAGPPARHCGGRRRGEQRREVRGHLVGRGVEISADPLEQELDDAVMVT